MIIYFKSYFLSYLHCILKIFLIFTIFVTLFTELYPKDDKIKLEREEKVGSREKLLSRKFVYREHRYF